MPKYKKSVKAKSKVFLKNLLKVRERIEKSQERETAVRRGLLEYIERRNRKS